MAHTPFCADIIAHIAVYCPAFGVAFRTKPSRAVQTELLNDAFPAWRTEYAFALFTFAYEDQIDASLALLARDLAWTSLTDDQCREIMYAMAWHDRVECVRLLVRRTGQCRLIYISNVLRLASVLCLTSLLKTLDLTDITTQVLLEARGFQQSKSGEYRYTADKVDSSKIIHLTRERLLLLHETLIGRGPLSTLTMDMFCLRGIYQVIKQIYEPNLDHVRGIKWIMNSLRARDTSTIMKANRCDLAYRYHCEE